jgi:hypothetical protein
MDVTNSNRALNALNEHWPPKYNSSLLTVCNHGISGDQKTFANARSLITSLNTAMFQVMTQMTDYSKTKALLWITNSQIAEGHECHLMPVSQDKKQKENIKASSWIYACNKSRKLVRSITMLKLQNTANCCQTETSRTILNLSFCPRKSSQCPSVVLSVIVRGDRAWMGSCPSAASWWAAVMRALWCYGALPAITTATIRGFLSPPEWRISWWISWIAPWTISWIIIAARPSTFMITWVCCRHHEKLSTRSNRQLHNQEAWKHVRDHCNCSTEYVYSTTVKLLLRVQQSTHANYQQLQNLNAIATILYSQFQEQKKKYI